MCIFRKYILIILIVVLNLLIPVDTHYVVAVTINPDGNGQVLINPYYTTKQPNTQTQLVTITPKGTTGTPPSAPPLVTPAPPPPSPPPPLVAPAPPSPTPPSVAPSSGSTVAPSNTQQTGSKGVGKRANKTGSSKAHSKQQRDNKFDRQRESRHQTEKHSRGNESRWHSRERR